MNRTDFCDKLLPVIKHGFLRSEENVFPLIFEHPYTLWGFKNYWKNIFFRPEEAMFDNWQKLVSINKNLSC